MRYIRSRTREERRRLRGTVRDCVILAVCSVAIFTGPVWVEWILGAIGF